MGDDPPPSKFSALNRAIVDLVEQFSLVGFETLAVEDRTSMMNLLRIIDRAGGYAFGPSEGANNTVWEIAMRNPSTMEVLDVQERWIDRREEFDEMEKKQWEEEAKDFSKDPQAHQRDGMKDGYDALGGGPTRDSGIKIVRKG